MKHSKLITIFVVVIAAHRDVRAQSATAQAETLFRQGKELVGQGKFAEACAAFDASQKLEPTIATLLNHASCREKNGQIATAWGLFIDAERQSRAATDDPTRQLHKVASDHMAKLELRLSTLTLNVAADNRIGGLEILLNNEPVDPGAWNKPLPVDGNVYQITARAPGNADWSATVTVGIERDTKTIEVPKLKAAALQPAQRTSATAPTPPSSAPTETPRSKLVPLLVGGAALGLFVGALGFEVSARSTNDDANRATTQARRDSLWHSANNKRYTAMAFGSGGIVCAGVAVWLYLRGDHTEETSATTQARRLILEPVIRGDQTGLVLAGSY
jgi:hypothetical protein